MPGANVPARPPARSISLVTGEMVRPSSMETELFKADAVVPPVPNAGPPPDGLDPGGPVVMVNPLTLQPMNTEFTANLDNPTPPPAPAAPAAPAAPDPMAAIQAMIDERLSALQSALADRDSRLADMEFNLRLAQEQAPPSLEDIQLPEGVDPNATMTIGDFSKVLARYHIQQETAHLRTASGISSEEEQAALSRYPTLQRFQEPYRTQKVKEAVEHMRKSSAPPSAPAPAATPAPSNVRPAPTAVAAPEAGGNSAGLSEPSPIDAIAKYEKEMQAARDEKNPQTARRIRRGAWANYLQATGQSDEDFLKKPFRQSTVG